jgi:heme exporter protein C
LVLKILLGIWMAAVIVAAFLWVPNAIGHPAGKIIFFHVPNAMMAALAFITAAVYGVAYLRSRKLIDDAKSSIAAELGLLFSVLATITGSLFAKMEWHSGWNGDPREISMVVLLLVYAGYFGLRSAVDGQEKRARLSAVFAVLSIVPMVFLMFVWPRLQGVGSHLHPSNTLVTKGGLGTEYRLVLYSAALGFLGLYIWLFRIKTALAEIRLKLRRY